MMMMMTTTTTTTMMMMMKRSHAPWSCCPKKYRVNIYLLCTWAGSQPINPSSLKSGADIRLTGIKQPIISLCKICGTFFGALLAFLFNKSFLRNGDIPHIVSAALNLQKICNQRRTQGPHLDGETCGLVRRRWGIPRKSNSQATVCQLILHVSC